MAKGRQYNDDIREQARVLLSVNNNMSDVARRLGIPISTVSDWKKQFESEETPQNLTILRKKQKEEFLVQAWGIVKKANSLLERRLDRAIDEERGIDRAIELITSGSDIPQTAKNQLVGKLNALKCEDLRALSVVVGVMVDKSTASEEETEREEREPIEVVIKDFTSGKEDV